ncbi:MAG TPA: M20/M25/M40 family metallo-hydrolase [Acidobacteriota bacterium]|nr:M20/M25/M40 family metallo-hydrolase [Acidobacteriota bacterium]
MERNYRNALQRAIQNVFWQSQKRRAFLPLFIFLFFGLVLATESLDLTTIWKIKDEGLNRSQVMETLSYLTDVYGPRLTGSPNIRKAQEWAQKRLKEWGLVNVHEESYGPFGNGWALEHLSAEMLQPTYQPLIAFPKSWTPGTSGPVTANATTVTIEKESDFDKYRGKLKGMFVLTQPEREVNPITSPPAKRYNDEDLREIAQAPDPGARRGFPQGRPAFNFDPQFQKKLNEFYIAEGIAALLEPGRGDGGTIFVQSGGQRTPEAPPVPPQLVIAVEHYNRMVRILQKGIPVQLRIDVQARFYDQDQNAYNVIGEIPGTDKKDELVMLGAHFDSHHSGTGATDNAAGSAVAMEAVRILKTIGAQPRRTIRIALWSGEEQGLLGSRAYVSDHFASRPQSENQRQQGAAEGSGGQRPQQSNQPPPPITLKPEYSKLSAYFNLDNGTGKARGVYLQGNEEARGIFNSWMEPFHDMGMTTLSIRNTGGTDHLSFDAVGLPGFQFIQDPVEYGTRTHHSNMDVYDRIQRGDMMQASVIMASFVWEAGIRDQKFPRKPLPRGQEVVQPKP